MRSEISILIAVKHMTYVTAEAPLLLVMIVIREGEVDRDLEAEAGVRERRRNGTATGEVLKT